MVEMLQPKIPLYRESIVLGTNLSLTFLKACFAKSNFSNVQWSDKSKLIRSLSLHYNIGRVYLFQKLTLLIIVWYHILMRKNGF